LVARSDATGSRFASATAPTCASGILACFNFRTWENVSNAMVLLSWNSEASLPSVLGNELPVDPLNASAGRT